MKKEEAEEIADALNDSVDTYTHGVYGVKEIDGKIFFGRYFYHSFYEIYEVKNNG